MKVQLFYFEGCPSCKNTVKDLKKILKQRKVKVKVEMVEIKNQKEAEKLKFIGSPTVRVNGKDVDPTVSLSKSYGLRCRVYYYRGKIFPSPPIEMITKSIEEVSDA